MHLVCSSVCLIVETSDLAQFENSAVFAHSRVGQNGNPESKIEGFANVISKGIGDTADIAFFKFCFLDITAKTDIEKVFNHYKSSMSLLKKKIPENKVH